MNKPVISDGDLMAEKLGMIHLCANCHKRIYLLDDTMMVEIIRSMLKLNSDYNVWVHQNEKTGEYKIRCRQNNPNLLATPRIVE